MVRRGIMSEDSALTEFKTGINFLRKGSSAAAFEHLRRAAELDQKNPYYVSFLGVSVARSQRKWSAAVELCESALKSKRNEVQFYLNLAEVYVSAGRRDDAVEVLDKGLIYFRADTRMQQARANLGKRCTPVLPFLDRAHFLNRSLGKLRGHLSGRHWKPVSWTRISEPQSVSR